MYFLVFCLLDLSFFDRRMLKSPTIIFILLIRVDSSVSLCTSTVFALCTLMLCCLVHIEMQIQGIDMQTKRDMYWVKGITVNWPLDKLLKYGGGEVFYIPMIVAKSCLTLCDPMNSSPPSSVQRFPMQEILEIIVISFSRRSSSPRD